MASILEEKELEEFYQYNRKTFISVIQSTRDSRAGYHAIFEFRDSHLTENLKEWHHWKEVAWICSMYNSGFMELKPRDVRGFIISHFIQENPLNDPVTDVTQALKVYTKFQIGIAFCRVYGLDTIRYNPTNPKMAQQRAVINSKWRAFVERATNRMKAFNPDSFFA